MWRCKRKKARSCVLFLPFIVGFIAHPAEPDAKYESIVRCHNSLLTSLCLSILNLKSSSTSQVVSKLLSIETLYRQGQHFNSADQPTDPFLGRLRSEGVVLVSHSPLQSPLHSPPRSAMRHSMPVWSQAAAAGRKLP